MASYPHRSRVYAILAFLKEGAHEVTDTFWAVSTLPYGSSSWAIEQKRRALRRRRDLTAQQRHEMQRYRNLISYLKNKGLVSSSTSPRGKSLLALTEQGVVRLTALQQSPHYSCRWFRYRATPSPRFTIVSFDIPERFRAKRAWLRDALRHLGFRLIQQSFFVGKVTLPQEFLDDLRTLNLLPFVELCSVTKRGTLHAVRPRHTTR
jgi:hypothetical protein